MPGNPNPQPDERGCSRDIERFEECVVCGAEDHDGDGWIFHTADTEVVGITENGVERELKDDARPICSIECKDEFNRGEQP